MKKLFKNRNFFLLFQGSLVSAIGTSAYSFAAGLYIQSLFGKEGGAFWLGIFMAVNIGIMILLSPIAGLLADRINKIRILYLTDFLRSILFFITLYTLTLGFEKETLVWILLGVTAIASINQAFFGPAATAVIPEVVGEDMIQAANGANNVIGSLQTILGIIVGTVLFGLIGFEAAVLANAISFVFSAISEMFIRTKYEKQETEERKLSDHLNDIKFGFKYIVNKEGLLTMMLFSLMLNFCFSPLFSVGIPYLFYTELGASEFEVGAVEIAFSIVALFASIVVGGMKLKSLRHSVMRGIMYISATFIFAAIIIALVTYSIIGYWVFFGLFVLAMSLFAITTTYTNIPLNTGMMKAIEPEVRGRVFATIHALSMGAIPISAVLAGILIDKSNVATLGFVLSILVIIITLFMKSNQKVKSLFDSIDKNNKEIEEKKNQAEIDLIDELEKA